MAIYVDQDWLSEFYPKQLGASYIKVDYDFDTLGCWYRDLDSATPYDKELVLFFRDNSTEQFKKLDEKPHNYFNDDYIKRPLAEGETYSCPLGEGSGWQIPGFTFGECKHLRNLAYQFENDPDCDTEGRFDSCKTEQDREYRQSVRNKAKLKAFNTIIASKALKDVINAG